LCSPCGHFRRCLCFRISHRASTFLPPLPRRGFATHAFRRVHTQHARRGIGTMRALNPAAPRQCDRPLRSICLAFRASSPQTRCAAVRHVSLSPPCVQSVPCGSRLRHTFAGSPLRPAETGSLYYRLLVRAPAAPHPALNDANKPHPWTTQLLSATCTVTSHGTDSHYAD
jgi:hypothetical protein